MTNMHTRGVTPALSNHRALLPVVPNIVDHVQISPPAFFSFLFWACFLNLQRFCLLSVAASSPPSRSSSSSSSSPLSSSSSSSLSGEQRGRRRGTKERHTGRGVRDARREPPTRSSLPQRRVATSMPAAPVSSSSLSARAHLCFFCHSRQYHCASAVARLRACLGVQMTTLNDSWHERCDNA